MKKRVSIIVFILLCVILFIMSLVACSGTSSSNSNNNIEVKYNIILTKNIELGGSVSGEGEYTVNSEVTIKAITKPGYVFLGWFDGDKLVSNDEKYDFVMPEKDCNYIAKWEEDKLLSQYI